MNHTLRYRGPLGDEREYFVLSRAISRGVGLIPHLMVHGYLSLPRRGGAVLLFGVARTRDIVQVMSDGLDTYGEGEVRKGKVVGGWWDLRVNPVDGVIFGAVQWKDLITRGMPLVVFRPAEESLWLDDGMVEYNDGLTRLWTP